MGTGRAVGTGRAEAALEGEQAQMEDAMATSGSSSAKGQVLT